MKNRLWSAVVLLFCCVREGQCQPAAPLSALSRLPVREVTVFKDGHAFVLHEGKMPTDSAGNVMMDYLPTPVLGTFWPYSNQNNAKLTAVVASRRKVLVPHTCLNVEELIQANPSADVSVDVISGSGFSEKITSVPATISGVPTQSSEELEQNSPPNSGEKLPVKGNIVLLKTTAGVQAVPLGQIPTVTFKGQFNQKLAVPEFRNLLDLKLKWHGAPEKTADVGMVYLQKGLRWIPNYKVNLHDDGNADIKLQATLINELTDLEDVTANLVIGVPSFNFADTNDPMALQDAVAQLSPYFEGGSRTAGGFSNAIMSQTVTALSSVDRDSFEMHGNNVAGPDVGGSAKNEDLFIFTAHHLTLKKGQRMVVPIAEYSLKYKDLYTLDIPFKPPQEVRMTYRPADAELAKQLSQPVVKHKIHLTNSSGNPLTTAPAMILKDDQLIAQSMMTYTAITGQSDLDLTTAVDVKVKKTDRETKRTPDALRMQGDSYGRVDVAGQISLTNFAPKPIEVEVTRMVLGKVESIDASGKSEMINAFEDLHAANMRPAWWAWYEWPVWWNRVNGMGKASWTVKLSSGKSIDLPYTWSYFWR